VIFIEGNDFVDRFFRSVATSLGLLDLLRVPPLLDDEIKDVKHIGIWCALSRAAIWVGDGFESSELISLTQTQAEFQPSRLVGLRGVGARPLYHSHVQHQIPLGLVHRHLMRKRIDFCILMALAQSKPMP
jgi:hypothetical protein